MDALIALVALTSLEIVLGIDNIVLIAVVTDRLPESQQETARRIGLIAAMVMRILLLLSLSWVLGLTTPVFELTQLGIPEAWFADDDGKIMTEIVEVSWRDIILFAGGLVLIAKSVREIHERFEEETGGPNVKPAAGFKGVIVQIMLLDIVFSLDSVITAVGMAKRVWVMVLAIILAVSVMLVFANRVSRFVKTHPTLKMLALSFLIMIGVMLVAESVGTHISKGYIYFAMAFALGVECLNLVSGARRHGDEPTEGATPANS